MMSLRILGRKVGLGHVSRCADRPGGLSAAHPDFP
jgi:hypothetical protein